MNSEVERSDVGCEREAMLRLFALSLRRVQLFVIPWTVAHQAPLFMAVSRREYWSGLPCPPPGGLPNPGIEPGLPALQADSLLTKPPGKPRESLRGGKIILITPKSKKHDRMFLNHLKPATFDT